MSPEATPITCEIITELDELVRQRHDEGEDVTIDLGKTKPDIKIVQFEPILPNYYGKLFHRRPILGLVALRAMWWGRDSSKNSVLGMTVQRVPTKPKKVDNSLYGVGIHQTDILNEIATKAGKPDFHFSDEQLQTLDI